MFTFLLISIALLALSAGNSDLRSSLDRMSLAFEVQAKPYEQAPKPKKPKDKFKAIKDNFALIKTSGIGVVGISGKIGGTVFNLSGSQGAFARNWAKPRNVRNAFTQLVRGLLSGISTAWKGLTNLQIDAWNAAAPVYSRVNVFGDARSLKGNTSFQRVNNIRASLALASVTDPPAITPLAFVVTNGSGAASLAGTSFDLTLTDFFAGTVLPAGHYIKAYGTTYRPVSQSFFGKSSYRYFAQYPPTTATNPLDIYADFIAKFGTLRVGTKVSIALEVVKANSTDFNKSGLFYITTIIGV